jgi:hypothetical protein
MRYIATVSSCLLIITISVVQAQPRSLMGDPVFGMTYDTRKVHFENAPAKISQLCRDLSGETFWLYAYYKTPDAEYFVLSNSTSEVSGVGLVLRGTHCTEGLPDWILSGNAKYHPFNEDQPVVFNDPILHGLASDLLRRYSSAFGGKKYFIDAVKKSGLPPNELVPPLRTDVERFIKAP